MSAEQLATLHIVFKHISEFDYDALKQHVDPNFRHFIRPSSLGGFGHPNGFTFEEVTALSQMMRKDISSTEFEKPRDLVCEQDKIAVWVDLLAKTQDGESISGEHFYIFTFTPGTTKILKVVEMLDSLHMFKASQKRGRPLPGVEA